MNNEGTVQDITNEIKPTIKYGWLRSLLYLLATLFVTMIGQAIGLVFVAILFGLNLNEIFQGSGSVIQELGPWAYFIITLIGFLILLLITWVFRKFIDKKSLISLGFEFRKYKFDFIQGLLWGIGLIIIGYLVLLVLGNLQVESIQFFPLTILGYLLLFFVVSLNEEIMVRGYILSNLSESVNKYVALIITAVLFGLLHGMNANINAIGFINIILAGILLGIYYVHKQNLWFPIGIHFTWNFFQGPVFGFEVSGQKTDSIITQQIQGHELLTGGEFGFEASLFATALMVLAILVMHFQFKQKSETT